VRRREELLAKINSRVSIVSVKIEAIDKFPLQLFMGSYLREAVKNFDYDPTRAKM